MRRHELEDPFLDVFREETLHAGQLGNHPGRYIEFIDSEYGSWHHGCYGGKEFFGQSRKIIVE